jgi:omega-amidase
VYDFKGEPLIKANDDQQALLTITLNKAPLDEFRAKFPAHLDADAFTLV